MKINKYHDVYIILYGIIRYITLNKIEIAGYKNVYKLKNSTKYLYKDGTIFENEDY